MQASNQAKRRTDKKKRAQNPFHKFSLVVLCSLSVVMQKNIEKSFFLWLYARCNFLPMGGQTKWWVV
jgi:hypothetical protein